LLVGRRSAEDLDYAKTVYQWMHEYYFKDADKTLAPIAMLKVNDETPLPKIEGLCFCQIAALGALVADLAANVLIKLRARCPTTRRRTPRR